MERDEHPLTCRAWYLGARLDVRPLERGDVVARSPLTVQVGGRGRAVLFRYGSVVFFDVAAAEQARFLHDLGSFLKMSGLKEKDLCFPCVRIKKRYRTFP